MKFHATLLTLSLVALSLLWMPAVTASTSPEPAPVVQEAPAALFCSASLAFEAPSVFAPAALETGCSESQCNKSCWLQGYDYGVCFGSTCICRFWYP